MKKHSAKNGKMTLDKLARMVQKGFEATATKAEMNERFKQIEERFNGVDERFQGIDNKIDALYFEIKDIKSSIPPLITTVGHLEGEMLSVRQRLSRLEKKVGLSK